MGHSRIEDKGELTREIGGDYPVSYHVDMGQYGYSNNRPLFTWGALPCLIIVVHNIASDRGCLSHKSHDSMNQAKLYHDAEAATRKMLSACGNPYESEIYLLAGQAFIPGSHYATQNPQNVDIATYMQQQLGVHHHVKNFLHHALGQILYWPERRKVYFVSDDERTEIQNRMVDGSNAPLWVRLTPVGALRISNSTVEGYPVSIQN